MYVQFSFSRTLHCSHYLCATVQTYITYTTIITTITIRLLSLTACNLFASHTCTLFCTQLRSSNTQTQHKTDCLQLTVVCSVLQTYSLISTFLKLKVFASPSRLLYCDRLCMCLLTHVLPLSLLSVVYLKAVRCFCQCIFVSYILFPLALLLFL